MTVARLISLLEDFDDELQVVFSHEFDGLVLDVSGVHTAYLDTLTDNLYMEETETTYGNPPAKHKKVITILGK